MSVFFALPIFLFFSTLTMEKQKIQQYSHPIGPITLDQYEFGQKIMRKNR